jgi:hypothetical protein
MNECRRGVDAPTERCDVTFDGSSPPEPFRPKGILTPQSLPSLLILYRVVVLNVPRIPAYAAAR